MTASTVERPPLAVRRYSNPTAVHYRILRDGLMRCVVYVVPSRDVPGAWEVRPVGGNRRVVDSWAQAEYDALEILREASN
jgi:hypothetical protein